MRNLVRLIPFVWPYRARVAWSIGFAIIVALLWGANLSATFPVVKVLLEKEDLHTWVDEQIAEGQAKIQTSTSRISELNPDLVGRRARSHTRLTAEHQRVNILTWVRSDILPWVPRDTFRTIAMLTVLLFAATIIKGMCNVCQTVLVGSVVELTTMRLRKHCFRHCLSLDYHTLSSVGTSELVSRMTNDITQVSAGLRIFGVRLIREPLKAFVCLGLAFAWNWRLTLLAILVTPVIVIALSYFGKLVKRASKASMESLAGICNVLSETFGHARLVVAFHGFRRHRQMFHRQNKALFENSMRGVRASALISPTNEVLGVLAAILTLLPAMYMVFCGQTTVLGIKLATAPMDLADVTLLYAFLAGTLDPIHKLSGIYGQYKKAAAATERVFELLERESSLRVTDQSQVMGRHEQSVRFESVSFSYPTDAADRVPELVLRDVTAQFLVGDVVAVVGPNGCGKSTLVNLLLRFADPLSGAVLIDDVDLRHVAPTELRSHIGLVMQETLLFDTTVYENILYGNPDATAEQVLRAADESLVTPFLSDLPEGIHTRVGENGTLLSGGQRQRIALARALIRDPSILILDEATSAVDAHSERLIYQCLRRCCQGRTVFIVAHSLSPALLELVTRVVVMNRGQIVAMGDHDELLESCSDYRGLNKIDEVRKAG